MTSSWEFVFHQPKQIPHVIRRATHVCTMEPIHTKDPSVDIWHLPDRGQRPIRHNIGHQVPMAHSVFRCTPTRMRPNFVRLKVELLLSWARRFRVWVYYCYFILLDFSALGFRIVRIWMFACLVVVQLLDQEFVCSALEPRACFRNPEFLIFGFSDYILCWGASVSRGDDGKTENNSPRRVSSCIANNILALYSISESRRLEQKIPNRPGPPQALPSQPIVCPLVWLCVDQFFCASFVHRGALRAKCHSHNGQSSIATHQKYPPKSHRNIVSLTCPLTE